MELFEFTYDADISIILMLFIYLYTHFILLTFRLYYMEMVPRSHNMVVNREPVTGFGERNFTHKRSRLLGKSFTTMLD